MHVFGSVRQAADAERLQRELGSRFTPLVFDVTDDAGVIQAARHVEAHLKGCALFGLVNNAGVAFPGPLLHLPIGDFRRQLEVNLTAQLFVTQTFLPLLGTDETRQRAARARRDDVVDRRTHRGAVRRRLQRLQVRARRPVRKPQTRADRLRHRGHRHRAGRHRDADLGQADTLDIDCLARTPYGPAMKLMKAVSIENGRRGLPAEVIGRTVLEALTAVRPKVRYTVTPEPVEFFLGRVLPKRFVDRLIAGRLGWKRPRG